jgi:tripartite-type tricarboxylate transporter receptor subunit TctC
VGDGTSFYPTALRGLMNMQFRVINGYASTANIFIAMEQGEVDGVCESYSSTMARHPDYIRSGTVNVLFQAALKKEPGLGTTPSLMEIAPDAQSKEALELLYAGQSIGRPFLAPPGEPPEIVKMQRDAFEATMKDADFIDDAKRQKLVLKPESGVYLDELFAQLYATTTSVVERVGAYVR